MNRNNLQTQEMGHIYEGDLKERKFFKFPFATDKEGGESPGIGG